MISDWRKNHLKAEYETYMEEYDFLKKLNPNYFPEDIRGALLRIKLQEVVAVLGDTIDAIRDIAPTNR